MEIVRIGVGVKRHVTRTPTKRVLSLSLAIPSRMDRCPPSAAGGCVGVAPRAAVRPGPPRLGGDGPHGRLPPRDARRRVLPPPLFLTSAVEGGVRDGTWDAIRRDSTQRTMGLIGPPPLAPFSGISVDGTF